jgi:hypothetical protein
MISFRAFISEGYLNIFNSVQKEKYAEEAYSQLQNAYRKVGGLKGSGFETPFDMINNIPFWKIKLDANGRILAAAYYKDKEGRKRVAVSSDGTVTGKRILADIIVSDLKHGRAYAEQSGSSLRFLVSQIGYDGVKKYVLPIAKVSQIIPDEIRDTPEDDVEVINHPELAEYFYQRKIGGHWHTKIAIGTPSIKMKEKS